MLPSDDVTDQDHKIAALAHDLTREEIQEMFAISWTSEVLGYGWASRIMSVHFTKAPCGTLLAKALVEIRPKKLGAHTHHQQRLTRLGTLVMLLRIEREIPWLTPAPVDEDAC